MARGRARLRALVEGIRGRRAVVLGDVMLDEYVFGTVSRISPEAPVPVVDVDFGQHTCAPGGATNVAHNLRALGAEVSILGVVGDDPQGQVLRTHLEGLGVNTAGLLVDPSRPTTLKTRIIAHSQQVVRVDRECRQPLGDEMAGRLQALLEAEVREGAEVVLISDYDKGVASGSLPAAVIAACKRQGIPITANPKPPNLERLQGATVVTLNQLEAEGAAGRRLPDEESLQAAGEAVRARLDLGALLITRGSRGMLLVAAGGCSRSIPAVPVEVYDVVGAGDTAVSTLSLALVAGAGLEEAAVLANLAAAAVVRKVGTAVLTPAELLEMIDGHAVGVGRP